MSKEFHDPADLLEALDKTKIKIKEYKESGADASEFEIHAKHLKRQLLNPKERTRGLVEDQIGEAKQIIEKYRENNENSEVEKWEKHLQDLERQLSELK